MSGMPALPYRHISNQQQLDELGFSVRFSWSDGAGHSFRERDADDTTGCQELEGFLPCEMDVRLEVEVAIEHPRKIFGNFAAKDAELGLALQYQFEKLGNQGAMPFENCVITDQDKSVKSDSPMSFRSRHSGTSRDLPFFCMSRIQGKVTCDSPRMPVRS